MYMFVLFIFIYGRVYLIGLRVCVCVENWSLYLCVVAVGVVWKKGLVVN